MQKRRTQQFKITFLSVSTASTLFLAWLAAFGTRLAATHFQSVLDAVLSVMMLATVSFLTFSFLPYFNGDKRWYSIPALLTVVFFVGAVMLWSAPLTGVVTV